jgi:hypothetical protein
MYAKGYNKAMNSIMSQQIYVLHNGINAMLCSFIIKAFKRKDIWTEKSITDSYLYMPKNVENKIDNSLWRRGNREKICRKSWNLIFSDQSAVEKNWYI